MARRIGMEVVCENKTCNNKGDEDDFDNNIGVPLCDDCYTVVRYMVTDELDVHIQQLEL